MHIIFFDMDGTLIKTGGSGMGSWRCFRTAYLSHLREQLPRRPGCVFPGGGRVLEDNFYPAAEFWRQFDEATAA